MNDQQFDELLASVQDMGKHMRGEAVAARVREFLEPDVKAIREKTGLSQTGFAYLIGVKPKTLQNWEQKRVRPAGHARALLKIVEANPEALAAIQA
jgi:putative transcriptional regulator